MAGLDDGLVKRIKLSSPKKASYCSLRLWSLDLHLSRC